MESYIDTMHGTGATIAQSTEVARAAVDSVNLEADSELSIRLIRSAIMLIFSVTLEDAIDLHDR